MSVNWASGYTASYSMTILDDETLRDIDQIGITGGSIKRTITDLRESGDLTCKDYITNKEIKIRVWLDVHQDGNYSHTPLFTGLATSPRSRYKGSVKNNTLQCYSLLKIAQDILLPRGWYAPYDSDSGELLKDLLGVIGTDITIDPNEKPPLLAYSIIAEQNENNLSMVDKILDAINWRLRIHGDGSIYIGPHNTSALESFNSITNDVIESDIDIEYDWYNAPNIFRAVADGICAVARDDDPNSEFSTFNRKREIWIEENNVSLNANETLSEYAQRRLLEYQSTVKHISYNRRYFPEIFPGDIIEINYPVQNISGLFLITDQTVNLGHNSSTSEEVMQI